MYCELAPDPEHRSRTNGKPKDFTKQNKKHLKNIRTNDTTFYNGNLPKEFMTNGLFVVNFYRHD